MQKHKVRYMKKNEYDKSISIASMQCNEKALQQDCCNCVMFCDEYCSNRLNKQECNQFNCGSRLGVFCGNRHFEFLHQFSEIPTEIKYIDEDEEYGLAAGCDIENGMFISEYIGRVIDKKTCLKERKINSDYIFKNGSNMFTNAYCKGNEMRYINFSNDPNVQFEKWTVNGVLRIGIYAIKDIKMGEEITVDYGADFDTAHFV